MPRRRRRKQRGARTMVEVQRHFLRRLFQRYGIEATPDEYREMNNLVGTKGATFLWRESLTRAHYEFDWAGQTIRAVYLKTHGAFVTALPREGVLT